MSERAVSDTRQRFKPYPAYKDSGVEWLGEIPAHWEVKRVKNLSRFVTTRTRGTVEGLIGELGFERRRVAIAINRDVVPRSAFATHRLGSGDRAGW